MMRLLPIPWMLACVALSLFPFSGSAGSLDDARAKFDSANVKYEQGEFAEALAAYEALLLEHRHFESEFNAGNAAFKLGKFGRARLHYERASKLDPTNDDLEANLRLLESSIVDRITPLPKLGLSSWLSALVGPGKLRVWSVWTLFWWTIGWGLLALRWRKKNRDSRATVAFLGGASLLLGLAGLWGVRQCNVQAKEPSQLVVMADRIDILSTPSATGTVLFQLHEGARACILDREGDWVEIQLDNGNVGWISAAATEDV